MGEQEPLRERPERERWFSKKQYEMLRRCSDKKDVTEWNEWREKHPRMPVFLEGAVLRDTNLEGAHFRDADLRGANFVSAHLEGADFRDTYLEGADFTRAHVEGVNFVSAHLEEVTWSRAQLEGAHFEMANLGGAFFWGNHLEGANFAGAYLKGANFRGAYLEGADFFEAYLEDAYFTVAHLEGANFLNAYLEGAYFYMAAVDGGTLLRTPYVNRRTDFTGVGLDNASVEPGLKQLLEYNVRRLRWEDWYAKHSVAHWPVWVFWAMSGYGRSTKRILSWFFGLALAFALVYWVCSLVWPPGMVSNLLGEGELSVSRWLLPVRALYFSIVTMTTLGFGDIYAHPTSLAGHLLLTLQVLLGYVLLAALVTRFAVLFTAGGPAAKFPDERRLLRRRLWSHMRVGAIPARRDVVQAEVERLREEARKFQRRWRS